MKNLFVIMFLLATFAYSEDVPLPIKNPSPKFLGTPKDIKSANLEPYVAGKPRPIFLAPKDCKNVALGKEVISSDMEPVQGKLEQITDGIKEADDGNYVEIGPRKQWFQVDLGKEYEIYAIVFWHYHLEARVYHDVIVQISNDPDFVVGVITVFNNDHDNSSGFGIGKDKEYIEDANGRLANAKGQKARYIRLYSNGSTAGETNHLIEAEIWGK